MGFLVSLGSSIGMAILKYFLSGLFNTVLAKIEDAAEEKKAGAVQYADSVEKSTAVEEQIIKKQAEVASVFASTAKPADDPFRVGQWNSQQ